MGTTKKEPMKALTVKEPHASRIYNGPKTIETRTWNTNYRGKLLLTASKKPEGPLSGKAFAVVTLSDCRPMEKEDEPQACCEMYPKAHSWFLTKITKFTNPFPIKGQLSLFEIKGEKIRRKIMKELRKGAK